MLLTLVLVVVIASRGGQHDEIGSTLNHNIQNRVQSRRDSAQVVMRHHLAARARGFEGMIPIFGLSNGTHTNKTRKGAEGGQGGRRKRPVRITQTHKETSKHGKRTGKK